VNGIKAIETYIDINQEKRSLNSSSVDKETYDWIKDLENLIKRG